MPKRTKKKQEENSSIVFFETANDLPLTIAIRLTNSNNSATSLFRLTDISNRDQHDLMKVTTKQSDRESFDVSSSQLQTEAGRTTLMLDYLPVAQSKSDVTLSVSAVQNGQKLAAFDEDGHQIKSGPNGAPASTIAVATPAHCGIVLLPPPEEA